VEKFLPNPACYDDTDNIFLFALLPVICAHSDFAYWFTRFLLGAPQIDHGPLQ